MGASLFCSSAILRAHRVQHRGVVASAEQLADLRQAPGFCVSSLARYMAIRRGRAILAGRFFEYMSATLML